LTVSLDFSLAPTTILAFLSGAAGSGSEKMARLDDYLACVLVMVKGRDYHQWSTDRVIREEVDAHMRTNTIYTASTNTAATRVSERNHIMTTPFLSVHSVSRSFPDCYSAFLIRESEITIALFPWPLLPLIWEKSF
jgi:hypothetical protein